MLIHANIRLDLSLSIVYHQHSHRVDDARVSEHVFAKIKIIKQRQALASRVEYRARYPRFASYNIIMSVLFCCYVNIWIILGLKQFINSSEKSIDYIVIETNSYFY